MIPQNKNSNQDELVFHLTQVIILLKNELAQEITSSIISSIDKKGNTQIQNDFNKLLTTSELANFLGVSKSTIVKLRGQNLPIIKIGDAVRFDKQEVLKFIQKFKLNSSDNTS